MLAGRSSGGMHLVHAAVEPLEGELTCDGSKESHGRSPIRTTLNPACFMMAMSW